MVDWNGQFVSQHPGFFPIRHLSSCFEKCIEHWPSVEEYNRILQQQRISIYSGGDKKIRFVAQRPSSGTFEQTYEPAIYLRGEVATRTENWHDFFNFCAWLLFPKTKVYLNALQYACLLRRYHEGNSVRTLPENIGAQFDESGLIVVTSNKELLDLIRNFQWVKLFYDNKQILQHQLKFFIFGHGLYEKCLDPYIGLTGKGICFQVAESFFSMELTDQLYKIDELTKNHFLNAKPSKVRDFLTPIPILGYPQWHGKQDKEFYLNEKYFRPLSKPIKID